LFDPDAFRYYLCATMPETSDSDFTWTDFVARNNNELVATWGNLVNRVLTMTYRNFDGRVPDPGALDARCEALLERTEAALAEAGEHRRLPVSRQPVDRDGAGAGGEQVPG
jgi:methionyl-tRNA synthetase